MENLGWVRCDTIDGQKYDPFWCSFEKVILDSITVETGVYIIWHGSNINSPARTVRVGAGNIADRLKEHRADENILQYKGQGPLYVTWAEVPSGTRRDQIERYLFDQLDPLVGERAPDVAPLAVALPDFGH